MKFYHGTSHIAWENIKAEGVLFGIKHMERRCTFLALDRKFAEIFGPVILEVEYSPYDECGNIKLDENGNPVNDYDPSRWEGKRMSYRFFKVFEPIDIRNVKRVDDNLCLEI